MRHVPVFLNEAISYLTLRDKNPIARKGIYLDVTFGRGGHSHFLLESPGINMGSIVIGIDWDGYIIEKSKVKYRKFIKNKKLFLFQDNYRNLDKIVNSFQKKQKFKLPVRGVLFDFGLCSDQLDSMRGFSFNEPKAPLDMRFDREYNDLTAAIILNTWPEADLITIFRDYGDERYSRKTARAIVESRNKGQYFNLVNDLLQVLKTVLAPVYSRQKIHYATRIFQALRIAVNSEEENVLEGLKRALTVLARGGRIVAISFHSGEDRLVKNFFRQESRDCICPPQLPQCVCGHKKNLKIITKKPVIPSWEEVGSNPNARSAKLRVAEKI